MNNFQRQVTELAAKSASSQLSKCYQMVRSFHRVARKQGLTVTQSDFNHPDYDNVYTYRQYHNGQGDVYAVVISNDTQRLFKERFVVGYWIGGDDT